MQNASALLRPTRFPTAGPSSAMTATPTTTPTSAPTLKTAWRPPTQAPTGDCHAEKSPSTCLDQPSCSWCSVRDKREHKLTADIYGSQHCFDTKSRPDINNHRVQCSGEVEIKAKRHAVDDNRMCTQLNSAACIQMWDCKWCHIPSQDATLCMRADKHLPLGLGYCHDIRKWIQDNEMTTDPPTAVPTQPPNVPTTQPTKGDCERTNREREHKCRVQSRENLQMEANMKYQTHLSSAPITTATLTSPPFCYGAPVLSSTNL
jgi:hypothetical protein